ncbi:hypothetical protein WHR41_08111 [Cladosporium halotolerans]|uniref:HIT-type domain-containing protein n=1 Tax=Cladosporium halotolerans TaxID=1052096 RepID=A0AB34KH29_9PEZI
MSDQPQSLAELCSICYTEKPKYRCPRCKTQTCSLTCYKRHQQRASCNGQRDPAAYLKRSEWATPSGIDRDYNYLKSVERHVDRTGQDVRERGINTRQPGRGGPERGSAGNRKVSKAWMPGSALQKYLTENDVRVEKAPVGMSRQKTNLTRVTHKGNVMWTVEWIEGDGRKSVDDDSSEGRPIKDLWGEVMAKRLNAEKGKKRKREAEKQPALPKPSAQEAEQGQPNEAELQQLQPSQAETNHDQQTSIPAGETPNEPLTDPDSNPPKSAEQTQDESNRPEEKMEDARPGKSEHFYLVKPFTASKATVLVPINADQTLTACLKRQTVLEYPTIYVLPEAADALPEGFQLEAEYVKLQKAEEAEVEGLMQKTNQSTGGALNATQEEEKSLDANSILDMLKRDVGV